jgi:DNA-binding GntR family transcriptional regulator
MLREDAYERLKESLFSNAIKPGQFVSQKQLAELIGCPLGPTREAIQRLAAESLLQVAPQRGIVVSELSVDFIREVFHLRSMIEREAIRFFFERVPRSEIEALRREHEEMQQRASAGITEELLKAALQLDWRFHDCIVGALGNTLIENVYRVNSNRMRLIQSKRGFRADRLVPTMQEHIAILDAGQREGCQAAVAAIERHLEEARRRSVLL